MGSPGIVVISYPSAEMILRSLKSENFRSSGSKSMVKLISTVSVLTSSDPVSPASAESVRSMFNADTMRNAVVISIVRGIFPFKIGPPAALLQVGILIHPVHDL